MDRNHYACYALIASAFVLCGLIVTQLGGRVVQPAHAGEAILRDNLTVVTAQARDGEDALFVLDSITSQLMIYRMEVGKKRLELAASTDLAMVFERVQTTGGDDGGRRGR